VRKRNDLIVSAGLGQNAGVRRCLLLVALLAAGCGGGGGSASPPATTQVTPTNVQTVTIPETADPDETPSGEPTFEATLAGQAPTALAGAAWNYTVTATKDGQPASATAKMRVFVDDELVDTLGWFPFEGRLVQTHRWPRSLRGEDVVLQAEVEGEGGTQRVNFPVEVT
jgi:hypothetical protein